MNRCLLQSRSSSITTEQNESYLVMHPGALFCAFVFLQFPVSSFVSYPSPSLEIRDPDCFFLVLCSRRVVSSS